MRGELDIPLMLDRKRLVGTEKNQNLKHQTGSTAAEGMEQQWERLNIVDVKLDKKC